MTSKTILTLFLAVAMGTACTAKDMLPGSESSGHSTKTLYSDENAAPTPPVAEEDRADSDVALEPVAIGGAYLSCLYPKGQKQNSDSWQMICDVQGSTIPEGDLVEAKFHKVGVDGAQFELTIVSFDANALRWTLRETANTMFFARIEAEIYVNGVFAKTLATELNKDLAIVYSSNYFLATEPNNSLKGQMVSDFPDEDCVEFINKAAKESHAIVVNATSGPLGRFNDQNCGNSMGTLCKNIGIPAGPKWIVSSKVGPAAQAPTACPAGYVYAIPMTDQEVNEAGAVVDANPAVFKAWVPMTDKDSEGQFHIILR